MTYRGIDWDKSGGLEEPEILKSVTELLNSIKQDVLVNLVVADFATVDDMKKKVK